MAGAERMKVTGRRAQKGGAGPHQVGVVGSCKGFEFYSSPQGRLWKGYAGLTFCERADAGLVFDSFIQVSRMGTGNRYISDTFFMINLMCS